jgi:hypothetical protein
MGNLFEDVEPSPLTVARARTQPKVIRGENEADDPYHGFMIGDRVRCINRDGWQSPVVGEVYTVEQMLSHRLGDTFHGLILMTREGHYLGGGCGCAYPFELFELHDRGAGNG